MCTAVAAPPAGDLNLDVYCTVVECTQMGQRVSRVANIVNPALKIQHTA